MKRKMIMLCALGIALCANAEKVDVKSFRHAGPFALRSPFMIDSLDVNSRGFDVASALDAPLRLDAVKQGEVIGDGALPGDGKTASIGLAGFSLSNSVRTSVKINVQGVKNYRLFVNNNSVSNGTVTLNPSTHSVVIKYLSDGVNADSLRVSVETDKDGVLTVGDIGGKMKRNYDIYDVICGTRFNGISASPDGKYMIVNTYNTSLGGNVKYDAVVKEVATGREVEHFAGGLHWMPRTNKYYYTRKTVLGENELVAVNPADKSETVLASGFPDGRFEMSPSEDYLIFSLVSEGPKERKDVYEVLEPDDRQPGWRNRSYLAKYDLRTGLLQTMTYGHHNVWLNDISSDGKYLLVMKSESRLTQRPTTVFTLYRVNAETFEAEPLVEKDGFISGAYFSPDGKSVAITGSPEALGGIGKNVDEGQVPSMIDQQLYVMTLADKSVRAMTRDFAPNVQSVVWSKADGQIYFNAEDKDCIHLFRLNPKDGRIRMIDTPEEMVMNFSLANNAAALLFYGQSASNSDRLYSMNTKSVKPVLLEDLGKERLKDVELGVCESWNYMNRRGDTICCRYYLPPHFDKSKKYPMIVNYYGGCSPTSRNFESRYPHHAYAAMGYVVLVINPSGATGFGQKFSARHVNTAGEGVAEDIIESTKAFCAEHDYVNDKKIGCIGASYGGFMTQYLQTKTDMFAAAISHAGISDHTSYWGEGYWGYSYSEVSMAGSYPWKDKKLFVDQSPLFNADKVHTPLLFLHGSADNNVPVGESIQMFTALKLLGRETAMVIADAQDHHITDYNKRILWQNTIYAWFAKWLQDDSSWWEEMYKHKEL